MRVRPLVLVLLAVATTSATAAGPGAASAGTVPVTGTASSTLQDSLRLLVGSGDSLVYARTHAYTSNTPWFNEETYVDPDADLVVRTKTGAEEIIDRLDGHRRYAGRFSLVGSLLTADDQTSTDAVFWWNLRTGARGRLPLPSHGHYLGAAPSGVIYRSDGVIWRRSLAGTDFALPQPFGSNGRVHAFSWTAGMLVGNDHGRLRLLRFSHPGHYRDLDSGTSDPIFCSAAGRGYAACNGSRYDDFDGGYVGVSATLVPLDGSAPTTYAGPTPEVALSGDRIVFRDVTDYEHQRIGVLPAGGTEPEFVDQPASSLVTAFDTAQALVDDRHRVLAVTDTRTVTPLFEAAPSPVTASAFALGPGRVLDVDDLPDESDPAALVSARERTLQVSGGGVSVGSPRIVGSRENDRAPDVAIVSVSAGTTVYALDDPPDGSVNDVTLVVDGPRGRSRIDGVYRNGTVDLSGNRLLYERSSPNSDVLKVYVRDLVTGTDTYLRDAEWLRPRQVALSGDYVAYSDYDGDVFRQNLRTGDVQKVASPANGGWPTDVFIDGDRVGWSTNPRRPVNAFRNARSMGPITRIGGTIVDLTATGAVVSSAGVWSAYNRRFTEQPTRVSLTRWSGRSTPLLGRRAYLLTPQVLGDVVVWAGLDGRLRAAVRDVPLPRPRFLGNPDAPPAATPTASPWQLFAPYSFALTDCEVVISRNDAAVRSLPCNDDARQHGLAAATWDGTDNAGQPVTPGQYEWTIHAAGAAGDALRAGGRPGDVTGTVVVS